MSDEQKTCGGCAWFDVQIVNAARSGHNMGRCRAAFPICANVYAEAKTVYSYTHATECGQFRSHADTTLIAECHRKRSLGTAIPWSDVDRLVEMLAGKPLERRKRCERCYGDGLNATVTELPVREMILRECDACNGTGYQGGAG